MSGPMISSRIGPTTGANSGCSTSSTSSAESAWPWCHCGAFGRTTSSTCWLICSLNMGHLSISDPMMVQNSSLTLSRAGSPGWAGRHSPLCRAGKPVGERLYRKLQHWPAGRAARRRDLLQPRGSPLRHKLVARPLQSGSATQQSGLPPASTRNDDDASAATRLRFAPPPAHAGIRGADQLTTQPDRVSRAVHCHWTPVKGVLMSHTAGIQHLGRMLSRIAGSR